MSRVEAAALRLIARCLADPTNDGAIGAVLALLDLPLSALETSWGSQHYAAFELNAYPFAGVYLCDPVVGDPRKIWIGLSAAASHLEAGRTSESDAVLDAQVMPFVTPMHRAVNTANQAIPNALFDVLNDLLSKRPGPRLPTLGEAPDLEAPETGLGQIVRHLCTPIRCGFLLTKADMMDLGKRLELPRGFGDRRLELMNLFRGAARFERVPELFNCLHATLRQALDHQGTHWPQAEGWRHRLEQTDTWLTGLDVENWLSFGDTAGDLP